MEILNIIEPERFRIYLLVLMRVVIVLFMLPIFSTKIFPTLTKVAFAMVLSLLLYSVVQIDVTRFPMNAIDTGRLIIMELMIGLTLGLCIRFFFAIVQFAGQIVGFTVAIFQAVTQVQEMTLMFVPKIVAVFMGLLFASPWMLDEIISFTRRIIENIPIYIK